MTHETKPFVVVLAMTCVQNVVKTKYHNLCAHYLQLPEKNIALKLKNKKNVKIAWNIV